MAIDYRLFEDVFSLINIVVSSLSLFLILSAPPPLSLSLFVPPLKISFRDIDVYFYFSRATEEKRKQEA